jgi:hypothetical protein
MTIAITSLDCGLPWVRLGQDGGKPAMMSKKDYIRAAEIVKDIARFTSVEHASAVRQAFSRFFRGDNPRFDQDRFIEACEPNTYSKAELRNAKAMGR